MVLFFPFQVFLELIFHLSHEHSCAVLRVQATDMRHAAQA